MCIYALWSQAPVEFSNTPYILGFPHILSVLNMGIVHELTNNIDNWIDPGMGYQKKKKLHGNGLQIFDFHNTTYITLPNIRVLHL